MTTTPDAAMLASWLGRKPALVYTDPDGYEYNETDEWWKVACEPLPCFEALAWPGYGTAIIEDVIDGKPVVIQLWKGWCQRFFGSGNFPGGIGAEVGVYERIVGRTLPSSLSFLEPPAAAFFTTAVTGLDESKLWWPATKVVADIEWELINPVSKKVFFKAPLQRTYWRNKWMNPHHYISYQRKYERRWSWLPSWFPFNSRTPPFPIGYQLRYTINGKTYPVW